MINVLVAAYKNVEMATGDFESLVAATRTREVAIEGAILVARGPDGHLTVELTVDSGGRKGAGWSGGVAVTVGLLEPSLIARVVTAESGPAVADAFRQHGISDRIHAAIGDQLGPGTWAIVAAFDDSQQEPAARIVARSAARSTVQIDERAVTRLRNCVSEAMGEYEPDRTVLPIPDREFGGTIGRTLDASTPDWTMTTAPPAPEGAPNVLVVLIDDAGFGHPDTFGGQVATPNLTRIWQAGLAYNRFHVTALCSPTRAALLTGRNHHRVGFGSIAETTAPYPGYTATKPRSCAALPRILRENGYVTGGFGKWHLTPDDVQGTAGPFDRWPNAWGFDHFWGFLSGATGQYDPIITQDNATLGVPSGKNGAQYYLPDDLTDQAVQWLHGIRAQNTTRPWFMYYATGCAHAPHHVPKEWADQYRGKFDAGWDEYRGQTFERQKRLGVIPADARLTPRPDLLPAWDSLSEAERKLYVRQMEVFAGYSANADWNLGRLLDTVEEMGDLDNTLVFCIWGDNGASLEGTITGSFNEMTLLNGIELSPERQLELIEQYGGIEALGTDHTAPHYAAVWAHAGNTPFQWGKQVASHLGGLRNPMIVAWPNRITARQELRSQFTHAIDVMPTVLEAVGIPLPRSVDGIEQESIDGTSFGYTFETAHAPERHTTQYFEMVGNRAIYHEGWWACARLDRAPWDFTPETMARFAPGKYDPDQDRWELYYLPDDFSQAKDLAADHPEKLAELRELFWREAERNQVLPLLAGLSNIFGILPPLPTVTRYTFYQDVQNVQRGTIPRIYGRSYLIAAELTIPATGAEGVLVADADFIGGFSLWIDHGQLLHHTYSFLGIETYEQVSAEPLPTGEVRVSMVFQADANQPGTGGTVTLWANGRRIGGGRMPRTVPMWFSLYGGMDIGRDNGLVVDRSYEDKAPYVFTGTIKKVIVDLKPAGIAAERSLHHHASRHLVAEGIAA